ncbi:MAG: restriction endonuclease [Chloroflexaceae bacterium]|nr:restriction endonuclease [Chloroflexaceae bacterium]
MARKRHRRRQRNDNDIAQGASVILLFALSFFFNNQEWIPIAVASGLSLGAVFFRLRGIATRRRLVTAEMLSLSPSEFESRIAMLLSDLGWTLVQRVGGSGDQGVDICAEHQGDAYVVQCKRYNKSVSPAAIRELLGTQQHAAADRALLVTTGTFTRQGRDFARKHGIELWDGSVLAARVEEAQGRDHGALATFHQWAFYSMLIGINVFALAWALYIGERT